MSEIVTGGIENAPPWLIDKLDKFFRNQELAECAAAESRQKKAKKFLDTGRRSVDGLGRPVFEIDEFILGHWRNRLGYNPLKDSGWVKYMKKHFPSVRIDDCKGTRDIHVGWAPGLESSVGKALYKKSYG